MHMVQIDTYKIPEIQNQYAKIKGDLGVFYTVLVGRFKSVSATYYVLHDPEKLTNMLQPEEILE